MKKTILACVLSSLLLAGCGPQELTAEQKKQIESLKTELTQTETQISAAKNDVQQYSGGLLQALVTTKLEVLETNKALIQQRINAIESGAKIDITVPGTKADEAAANAIAKEIDALKKQIDDARKESSQYTGGLMAAMKMAEIATQEQTLAMLQQKYLAAKYGLADVKVELPPSQAASPVSSVNVPQNQKQEQAQLLPPADGPFGLQAGLTKKNIEDMTGKTLTPSESEYALYFLNSTPKKNPDFVDFAFVISPQVGLCQIRAASQTVENDSFGKALTAKFNSLSDSLSSLYGNGEREDLLLAGSIWKDAQNWMMGLSKKERKLNSVWDKPNDAMRNNKIRSIALDARANDSSEGFLYLEYTFSNASTCEAEIKQAKKSAL